MGRGNWAPFRDDTNPFSLRYFDLLERSGIDADMLEEEEIDDSVDMAYCDFYEEIWAALPGSFYEPSKGDRSAVIEGCGVVFARNGLAALVFDEEGEVCHQGVAMIALSEDYAPRGLAEHYVYREAKKLWKRLGGIQKVRSGPWMTSQVNEG